MNNNQSKQMVNDNQSRGEEHLDILSRGTSTSFLQFQLPFIKVLKVRDKQEAAIEERKWNDQISQKEKTRSNLQQV